MNIDKIDLYLKQSIDQKIFPGCVLGIVDRRGERRISANGYYSYENDQPMCPESLFDVASITKAIPTSSLALLAIEKGVLRLDDRLRKYVPRVSHSFADEITIRHLLTHTLDFGYRLSSFKEQSPDFLLEKLYTGELATPPGKRFCYANGTSILLGLAVEAAMGDTLDKLAEHHFFERLGMKNTTFEPLCCRVREIVPAEIDSWRGGVVVGEVHDESAWQLQKIIIPGSAGLFSTVPDLLVFLEMLLNHGLYRNHRFFTEETIRQMYTNQLEEIGETAGLGWELNQSRFMGENPQQVFGKTGFTGCVLMVNMKTGSGFVFLSNHIYPHRRESREAINKVYRDLANLIFEHL